MASNLTFAWAELFVDALARAGIVDAVVSPGARSGPLALAVAAHSELRSRVIVDERSAAFFALGQARASGRPSLLICTSGTAPAHYLPAVIEASRAGVPLVVVSADRGWEEADSGAPQVVDQLKLFGSHVRHFAELGVPDPSPAALRAVPRVAAQAVAASLGPIPGPVHVNARFRKPLEPQVSDKPEPWEPELERLRRAGPPQAPRPGLALPTVQLDQLAAQLAQAQRPLVVFGPSDSGDTVLLRSAAQELAQAGLPLLAEATSQVRFGIGSEVLGAESHLGQSEAPDLLIQVGTPPTSAAYASLIERQPELARAVVSTSGWNDPWSSASLVLQANPAQALSALAQRIRESASAWAGWRERLEQQECKAWQEAASQLEGGAFSEAGVARAAVEALPEGGLLAVGNSGPVRDLDRWCPPSAKGLRVLHQRGANGIDGLASGAAGARAASNRPTLLLLGDLSLLHDIGGLASVAAVGGPLCILVVNNGGGRIFERLPVGKLPALRPAVRSHFVVEHQMEFSHAAALFGLEYARAEAGAELREALAAALQSPRATLVEARVPPLGDAGGSGR